MINTIKRTALATAFIAMAMPAAAATFDFTGGSLGSNGTYDGDFSATVDGISVGVTAGYYDGIDFLNPVDAIINADCSMSLCSKVVTKNNSGLGVGGFFDSNQIDGRLGDDLISFVFESVVDFVSVTFSGVDGNDDFDLFVDGVVVAEDINIAADNPFSFAGISPAAGSVFSIGADGFNDDFRIASIQVAAVPLPAGLLLMLTGLGGLGLMRRRKTA